MEEITDQFQQLSLKGKKSVRIAITNKPQHPVAHHELAYWNPQSSTLPEISLTGRRRRQPPTRLVYTIAQEGEKLCATFIAQDPQGDRETIDVSFLLYSYLKTGSFKKRGLKQPVVFKPACLSNLLQPPQD